MTHDEFCQADMPLWCQCPTIAAIRADEREQAAQRVIAVKHATDCGEDERIYDYCDCHSQERYVAAARGEDASNE